jgi:transposase
VSFSLSPGQDGDGPRGRELLQAITPPRPRCPLLMDRAYEGNETRQLARNLGFEPVGPPRTQRLLPWNYDRELYKQRNEVERLFRRLKGFRRIFTRFDKLDRVFEGFILIALIFILLNSVNTP